MAPKPAQLSDELKIYLSSDPLQVDDVLTWWFKRRDQFPCLSRMARDYLSIPGTSVDVERVFSRGRLVLPHVRNRLSAQSTRALLCLGDWSRLSLVKDADVLAVTRLEQLPGNKDFLMDDGWDVIKTGPA